MTQDVCPVCARRERRAVLNVNLLVTQHFNLAPVALFGPSRKRNIALARHVGMWLMRQRGNSYPAIARIFSRHDHTTVMHGVRRVDGMMASNATFAAEVRGLLATLEGA